MRCNILQFQKVTVRPDSMLLFVVVQVRRSKIRVMSACIESRACAFRCDEHKLLLGRPHRSCMVKRLFGEETDTELCRRTCLCSVKAVIEYDSGMVERKIQGCMKRVVQACASVLSKPDVRLPGLV